MVIGAPVGDMGGGAGLLVVVVAAGEDAVDTASSGQKPLYGANPGRKMQVIRQGLCFYREVLFPVNFV